MLIAIVQLIYYMPFTILLCAILEVFASLATFCTLFTVCGLLCPLRAFMCSK